MTNIQELRSAINEKNRFYTHLTLNYYEYQNNLKDLDKNISSVQKQKKNLLAQQKSLATTPLFAFQKLDCKNKKSALARFATGALATVCTVVCLPVTLCRSAINGAKNIEINNQSIELDEKMIALLEEKAFIESEMKSIKARLTQINSDISALNKLYNIEYETFTQNTKQNTLMSRLSNDTANTTSPDASATKETTNEIC